jgi:hypothetical protein
MNGKFKRMLMKSRRLAKRAAITRQLIDRSCAAPKGAIAADPAFLHHMNYSNIIHWYIDQPFICRDCGVAELWKASARKRYVENWGGHTDARAIRCRACRNTERERKAEARKRSEIGMRLKLSRSQALAQNVSQ